MNTQSYTQQTITNSSLIQHVKWEQTSGDAEDKAEEKLGTLTLKFKTSDVSYTYPDVPYNIILEFLSAPSCGQYFSKNIKTKFQHIV